MFSAFADRVVTGPVRRIVVSRSNVWRSASQFWRLPTVENRSGLLLCKFQGDDNVLEPSIDHGGPRREFFRLLLECLLKHSGIFSAGVCFLSTVAYCSHH